MNQTVNKCMDYIQKQKEKFIAKTSSINNDCYSANN